MIALGCQVLAQVLDLFVYRRQQPGVKCGVDGSACSVRSMRNEMVVAVDPVLDPPTGHVGSDEAGRCDAHPAVDQFGPALQVAGFAAALKSLTESNRVVKLVQQNVPFDIGTRIPEPVDWIAQLMRFEIEFERTVHERLDFRRAGFVGVGDRVVARRARGAKVGEQRCVTEVVPGRQKNRRATDIRRAQRLNRWFTQVHAAASCDRCN